MPVLRKGDAAKLLRKDLGRRLLIWEMRKSENAPLLPSECSDSIVSALLDTYPEGVTEVCRGELPLHLARRAGRAPADSITELAHILWAERASSQAKNLSQGKVADAAIGPRIGRHSLAPLRPRRQMGQTMCVKVPTCV